MAKISIDIKSGELKKNETIVGIDLGTTHSIVALCNPDTGEPKALGGPNGTLVPSVIYFSPDQKITVGTQALPYLHSHPERTLYSVKRLLGRSKEEISNNKNASNSLLNYTLDDGGENEMVKVRINNQIYNPVELSSFILKELKWRAEQMLGTPVNKAVITVPAYFNDTQRQATRDAGKIAGLDVLRIINEPTAASLAYGIGVDPNGSKTIAVYDLGGGTFDISILRIEKGIFEVLATHGDTYLGGDDFDQAIVNHWAQQFLSQNSDNNPFTTPKSWRLIAEKAKKYLTYNDAFSETTRLNTHNPTQIQLTLTREELNRLITPWIEQTLNSCSKALQDAQLQVTEIDEVVLVGGSTRTPYVQESVKEFFQKKSVHSRLNPDEVVALGAAIEADILAGNRKDILLLDVTPLSLGLETLGGLMDFVITRNSKIPCKATRQYTTSQDGQTGIVLNIYQGEREVVSKNRKLGSFELKGIPPMPAGLAKIEVGFLLDADGLLTVDAVEVRSGVKQVIQIKPTYGLTDQEVESMLLDSLKNAQTDMEERMLIEAITEAEQLIATCERFIVNNASMLSNKEIKGTQKHINEVKKALELQNKSLILNASDALNTFTAPFAERLMQDAVSKSLKGNTI